MTDKATAFSALVERLIAQSLDIRHCAVCGEDLIRGEWFSQHEIEPCELVAAMGHLRATLDAQTNA